MFNGTTAVGLNKKTTFYRMGINAKKDLMKSITSYMDKLFFGMLLSFLQTSSWKNIVVLYKGPGM